jgi:uncharacterized protein (DUF58 family)
MSLPEQLRPQGVIPTERWAGIVALALVPLGVGVLVRHPPLVLISVVGVGYAAYARADTAPDVDVTVERELSEESPNPGDEVTVTVRLRNEGGVLPDLRVIDGVPPAIAAEEPARFGTSLRPGRTASFSYTITAVRGEHEWGPVKLIARNPSGSRETDTTVDVETTLRCHPELDASASLPLRGLTAQYSGRVPTDIGGSGLEFHSTREYRHGDPVRRINWARLARTGELSTLEFREERAATVVLLIDTREKAYRAPEPEESNAVERSVDAATQAFSALLDSGDRVGIAAFGPGECWLPPGAGADHRAAARQMFTTDPALSATPLDERFLPTTWLAQFRRRLPADAQLIFFSPMTDDFAVSTARRLDAYGHPVTVISPDTTVSTSAGRQLARIERANRLSQLRGSGVRVIDWPDEKPLALELERSARRWSV